MNKLHKAVVGIVTAAGLGLAVASAYADSQDMGRGTGPHAMAGMQHGMERGMGSGAMDHRAAGHGAGHAALTPEERAAVTEKMRNAKTPEERQKIAAATRAEMQKRAQATGASHPAHRGPGDHHEHSSGNR